MFLKQITFSEIKKQRFACDWVFPNFNRFSFRCSKKLLGNLCNSKWLSWLEHFFIFESAWKNQYIHLL